MTHVTTPQIRTTCECEGGAVSLFKVAMTFRETATLISQ